MSTSEKTVSVNATRNTLAYASIALLVVITVSAHVALPAKTESCSTPTLWSKCVVEKDSFYMRYKGLLCIIPITNQSSAMCAWSFSALTSHLFPPSWDIADGMLFRIVHTWTPPVNNSTDDYYIEVSRLFTDQHDGQRAWSYYDARYLTPNKMPVPINDIVSYGLHADSSNTTTVALVKHAEIVIYSTDNAPPYPEYNCKYKYTMRLKHQLCSRYPAVLVGNKGRHYLLTDDRRLYATSKAGLHQVSRVASSTVTSNYAPFIEHFIVDKDHDEILFLSPLSVSRDNVRFLAPDDHRYKAYMSALKLGQDLLIKETADIRNRDALHGLPEEITNACVKVVDDKHLMDAQ